MNGNAASGLRIVDAEQPLQLAEAAALFREYATSLGVDLGFQDFEAELATLPGKYAPPGGCLLLATWNGEACGCVAVRALAADTCEMKRLWTRPQVRRHGVGAALAEAVIRRGCALGYARMRLDTLASMRSAQALYRRLGFRPIPAYYDNPLPDVVYLELMLRLELIPPRV